MTERSSSGPEEVRALDPGDFSFVGFDDSVRALERRVRRLGIRDGEPRVSIVDDAVFVPTDHWRVTGERQWYGGVYTADGRPVVAGQTRRKGRPSAHDSDNPIPVATDREVDGEVVYLGPIFNHYGRVLLESLARAWYLTQVDPSVPLVVDFPNTVDRAGSPWLWRIFESFGVPRSRLLVLDRPTRLRRAIIPEPLFEQMHEAHGDVVRPFREVAVRLVGGLRPSAQPVYLSRRLLTSRQRPVVGEADLEDVLRENGFLVVHPETMPFEDQVRLVNAHADIFACIGSAAHTILFALGRPNLHLFTSDERISGNYFLCSALVEAPTTFVAGMSTGHRQSFSAERGAGEARTRGGEADGGAAVGTGPQATPQLVEVARIAEYLAERGFLTNRLRASLAGRDPALRECYDEAWLFHRVRKSASKVGMLLPPAIEAEAVDLSVHSWPVSAILTRYYAWTRQDVARADAMARQFATLAAEEFDAGRLLHYRADILGMATRVKRVIAPANAQQIAAILADRFLANGDDGEQDAD